MLDIYIYEIITNNTNEPVIKAIQIAGEFFHTLDV